VIFLSYPEWLFRRGILADDVPWIRFNLFHARLIRRLSLFRLRTTASTRLPTDTTLEGWRILAVQDISETWIRPSMQLQLDEGAVVGETHYLPLTRVPTGYAGQRWSRDRSKLFQAERDSLAVGIEAQHHDLDPSLIEHISDG